MHAASRPAEAKTSVNYPYEYSITPSTPIASLSQPHINGHAVAASGSFGS